jgi:PKHD-type hydroxylase
VEPVTRGVRIAAIAWIQSVIRDHAMRQVVADISRVMHDLGEVDPQSEHGRTLLRVYANLVRLVAET